MRHRLITTALIFIVFFLAGESFAGNDSFRCGGDLISLGDTMYEVRKSCGDPYYEQIIGERNFYKILKKKKYRIESSYYLTEWLYEGNSGVYLLVFEGTRLVEKDFIFE